MKVKAYNVYGVDAGKTVDLKNIDGKWVPARPIPESSIWNRLKLAWMIFWGEIDGLRWPGGQ